MVVVSPPTVKLPSMVALPEIARVVPVAEVKVKLENEPVPPETVAPVMVELVKVPPSVSLARDDERLEESLSDWRGMLGLVSTARICSRRITVLMMGVACPEPACNELVEPVEGEMARGSRKLARRASMKDSSSCL